jgi:hypothetical protein
VILRHTEAIQHTPHKSVEQKCRHHVLAAAIAITSSWLHSWNLHLLFFFHFHEGPKDIAFRDDPTSSLPSITGRALIVCSNIIRAASIKAASGEMVFGSLLMT